MATAVEKTVGTDARQYSTPQSYEDAVPADITAAGTDETWTGFMYNDSEFTAGVTFSGTTTDATHWILLTTAAGESFIDDAGAASNALKYDQSKGVGINISAAYTNAITTTGSSYITIEKLQVKRQANGGSNYCYLEQNGTAIVFQNMLIHQEDDQLAVWVYGSTCKGINSLIIQESAASNGVRVGNGASLLNCTVVCPSDVTSTATGLITQYSNNITRNNAVFGFSTSFSASGWDTTNSKNNCTDDSSAPGSSNQVSKTYANQFEATTVASHDFRLKSGSDCEANGTRDQTNTNDLDIIGQARSASAPDIGCWELGVAGGVELFRRRVEGY